MKYNLLEMTQDVLSSMDGDEVNSINDNTEAQQVSRVIRACYFDILSTTLPEATTIFQLEASGDNNKPVVMFLPDDAHNIHLVKYNKIADGEEDPLFTTLTPLSIEEFFITTQALTLSDINVASMSYDIGSDNITFLYRTDKAPDFYTVIEENIFIFDSYDSEVDTTLQRSKTFCVGEKERTFLLEDTYEIDLDEKQHIWLLNEAKALAFQEFKQMQHQKAEQTAKRHRIRAQHQKYILNDPWVNYRMMQGYGRRSNLSTKSLVMH